ncbi:hypothetical protein [Paenibacillus polymyxa]|uniref:hypothetical protein n=1 Tax=Paenibacillus polymyxa TaxID=1406 RepID=UPI0015E084C0|nr:hypothetical protein [Paenibacillus polymyxa]
MKPIIISFASKHIAKGVGTIEKYLVYGKYYIRFLRKFEAYPHVKKVDIVAWNRLIND